MNAAFEIGRPDLIAGKQLLAGTRHGDTAVDHHIAAVGKLQRMECILLDEEYRDALGAVEFANGGKDLLHDQRRKPERWLVEQQQARARHQCARDCEHLLLAAGKRAAALGLTLAENGKEHKGAFEVFLKVFRIGGGSPHLEVLEDRHAGEDAPALGRLRYAHAHDLMGGQVGDVSAVVEDASGAGAVDAADRHHQSGLAGTVRADESGDFSLVDVHVDAAKGLDSAIEGFNALDAEQRPCHGLLPFALPDFAGLPASNSTAFTSRMALMASSPCLAATSSS